MTDRTPAPRRTLLRRAVLGPAALAALLAVVAATVLLRDEEPSFGRLPYAFEALPVDGGGWVTGLVATPSGAVVARTDVGGAYRWDDAASRWLPLLRRDAVDEPEPADYSVDGAAVAPSDPDRVYLAVGDALEAERGRVLASDDGGRTWRSSDVGAAVDGNGEWRQGGARLAVSPDDSDLLLLGTREDGLLRSDDGGEDWEAVDAPEGEPVGDGEPAGVTFSVFDPEREDVVWAGVQGVGVLRSEDGGQGWDLVHETPGATPRDAELAADGSLYAVVAGGEPSVLHLSAEGDALPTTGPGGSPAVLAVDPQDPQRVVVGDEGVRDGFLWHSRDGGQQWQALDVRLAAPEAPWVATSDVESYLSAGELVFDPARPGTLWFAEGMGVWRTQDLAGPTPPAEVTWTAASAGIEELVANDALHAPDGAVLTASWDRGVFRHPAAGGAELPLSGRFGSAWSLDADPATPGRVVAVVDDHRYCCAEDGLAGQSGTSEDGGRTWRRFASLERGDHPEGLAFGQVVLVRGGDGQRLVWAPSRGGRVHHSTDAGATWRPADYPGSEHHFAEYLRRQVLVAEEDGAVSLLDTDGVMRSSDGGATWQRRRSSGLPGAAALRFNATMSAVPGRPGELLLTTGLLDEGSYGLFRSRDAGDTWEELPGLADVGRLAVGPALGPGGPPVLFATGRTGSTTGLWRSVDDAASWQLLSEAPAGRYQDVSVLVADPARPGELVLGFPGTGWLRGQPR